MQPLDARERAELCDRFDELGPDAPTLCGDWTTAELAAHLVVRERNPLAAPGILLGGPLARVTERAMAREAARGYAALIDRVRSGPPAFPWRVPRLRSVLNLGEYVIHHEDVRRANGEGPRTDRPDVDDALRPVVRRMASLQLRRSRVEAALVDDAGRTLASRGTDPARVVGRPTELVLWVTGRGAVADVAFEGDDDQVAAVRDADLSL